MILKEEPIVGSIAILREKIPIYRKERHLRRITSWIMLCSVIAGELGAPWDGEWHGYVGRDWFWTPPHILIYASIGGGGIVALIMVLLETLRYYKRFPGVDDSSTVRVFRVFHAPLGYVVAGFGALAALVAAPFDNYWHELYGIDVTLWAPFHMMGIIGSLIGIIGIIYIFASEATFARQSRVLPRRFWGLSALEWGTLLGIASLLHLTLVGFLQFPIIEIGSIHISTQLFPVVVCACLCLISLACLTKKPGAATLMTLWLGLVSFATELFVPWAVRTTVTLQGLHYRYPDHIPQFNLSVAIVPLFLLPSALIIDSLVLALQRRRKPFHGQMKHMWLLGLLITTTQIVIAPCLIMLTFNPIAAFLNMSTYISTPQLKLYSSLITFPILLIMGLIGVFWGASFGDIWHWSKR